MDGHGGHPDIVGVRYRRRDGFRTRAGLGLFSWWDYYPAATDHSHYRDDLDLVESEEFHSGHIVELPVHHVCIIGDNGVHAIPKFMVKIVLPSTFYSMPDLQQ
ncbi:MAG: hypothetical protein ACE5HI_12250 [bacterium]